MISVVTTAASIDHDTLVLRDMAKPEIDQHSRHSCVVELRYERGHDISNDSEELSHSQFLTTVGLFEGGLLA
ncbi:MAG: hypothetical protein O2856_05775, partial [Planctomycetota bacterium]|nr:hypothetical protein [Planctomycetota bacterium]